jgi:hypothetical protein
VDSLTLGVTPLGVATNSGTAALEAILRAVDAAGGEEDRPWTFDSGTR